MQFSLFMDKYPVFSKKLNKDSCSYQSVDEIIAKLRQQVDASPLAVFIAEFDHYAHTSSLEGGEIAADIRAAKSLVFCFGIKLPSPLAMAPRPRSFGVCELDDHFEIAFMEPPNPQMSKTMQDWVAQL